MTAEELVWAATAGGARALGMTGIGTIAKGNKADLIVMDIKELSEIPYSMGMNLVRKVIKNGKVVI
jgi:imidazolonepropionase